MSQPEDASPDSAPDDVTADANPRTAARLFVLPAAVAAVLIVVLALYFLFGALTREARSVDSYLVDVRNAEGNRRWQAAYELSRLLESGEAKVSEDTVAKALNAFRDAAADSADPRVRRYLALALGRLKDPAAVAELGGALHDADAETRIYAALAIGQIGDRRGAAALARALSDEDAGVRKASAFSLGALSDPSSSGPLREALHDGEIDVTWNAAVALARMGDPSGGEVLRSMADREFVERSSQSEDPASRSTVLITAVQGLAMIEDLEAIPVLKKLASSDPDPRVQQAAIEALGKLSAVKPAS